MLRLLKSKLSDGDGLFTVEYDSVSDDFIIKILRNLERIKNRRNGSNSIFSKRGHDEANGAVGSILGEDDEFSDVYIISSCQRSLGNIFDNAKAFNLILGKFLNGDILEINVKHIGILNALLIGRSIGNLVFGGIAYFHDLGSVAGNQILSGISGFLTVAVSGKRKAGKAICKIAVFVKSAVYAVFRKLGSRNSAELDSAGKKSFCAVTDDKVNSHYNND